MKQLYNPKCKVYIILQKIMANYEQRIYDEGYGMTWMKSKVVW